MIYVIKYRTFDFCGNYDYYLAGYFEADSDKEVEEALDAKPMGECLDGYRYEKLKLSTAQELIDMREKNTESSNLRKWL